MIMAGHCPDAPQMCCPSFPGAVIVLLCVCIISCSCALGVRAPPATEGETASERAWQELVKDSLRVPVGDATVQHLGEYSARRIHETYGQVLRSPRYAAKVNPRPFFRLDSIRKAFIRQGGSKYLLEMVLTSPVPLVEELASLLQADDELRQLFRDWRAERSQEVARQATKGKPTEEYWKALTDPLAMGMQQSQHAIQAFFMAIDPTKDASQTNIPAQQPEVHRVVVQVDQLAGELDVQFHQRVGILSGDPGSNLIVTDAHDDL